MQSYHEKTESHLTYSFHMFYLLQWNFVFSKLAIIAHGQLCIAVKSLSNLCIFVQLSDILKVFLISFLFKFLTWEGFGL